MVLTTDPNQWYKLRLGRVTNIDYANNTCQVRFYDVSGGLRDNILLAQPYLGRGWGIIVGVEIGSIVVLGEEAGGSIRILSYLPHAHFFSDEIDSFSDVTSDESPYRRPDSGEIVLQSKSNSIVAMNSIGDITLETPEGNVIEIDREADLIFQQSSQRKIISDNATAISGVVRRDIRGLEERELDIIFGSVTTLGSDFDIFTETIGIDPKYPLVSNLGGRNNIVNTNIIPGLFDPFFPDNLEQGRGSGANISDMLNPAITEWNAEIYEFGDGNPGIDAPILDDNAKKKGHIEPNVLGQISFGTLTNEIGRQIRFDYAFGVDDIVDPNMGVLSTKGHGRIWKTTESAKSFDHHFNRNNTLKSLIGNQSQSLQNSAPGHNTDSEWTVDSLKQTPTAVVFRALMHTKGVDNQGRLETNLSIPFRSGQQEQIGAALQNSYPGSLWELQVDKEGLTKWNIPAATSLGEIEPYRAGRSLLLNMEGDATIAIGRQHATGSSGIARLTEPNEATGFINRNDYPGYGRKDRSLTLDLAGNYEAHIGADRNVQQSIMVQADGSCAVFLGKETLATQAENDLYRAPITKAAKASSRQDRSLTARMTGNIELDIGSDQEAQQSIIITTTGGNAMRYGKDRDDKSLEIATTGGVDIRIQGPMKESSYALHIDANGKLHIKATGDIQVETEQKCHINAKSDIHLHSDSNITLDANNNINLLANTAINLSAPTISSVGGSAGLEISNNNCGIKCGSLDINALNGIGMLGSLALTGQMLLGGPGSTAMAVARVGDVVQAGPHIGQIISGSSLVKFA